MKVTEKIKKIVNDRNSESAVRIVFLGDSVTHGCFETDEKEEGRIECDYDYDSVYHAKLKRLFAEAFSTCPVNMINAGISGDGAQGGFNRLERDVLSANPDLVVVCFGLNDVHNREAGLQNYIDSMSSIFKELKKNNIDIIAMTPNMMCTYVVPQLSGVLRQTAETCVELQKTGVMDLYIDSLKRLCAEMDIPVCDCYSIWKNMYKYGADIPWLLANHINHPTRKLHDIFAFELFKMIMDNCQS